MARAAGLVLGYLADRAWGDPARFHPVAGFGRLATMLEDRVYAPHRARGGAFTATLVGGVFAAGMLADRAVRGRLARVLITSAATWAVVGSRSLEGEARAAAGLAVTDLTSARLRLRSLVGRDTTDLDQSGIARAVVESVAENTSDAVVAPLFWGGLLGVPGLVAYRAANTLDAMIGHRNARYGEFGWAAARLDDVLNLVPARLTAGLTILLAPERARAWAVVLRDGRRHPSPNAGPVEAAFAGALGVQLGGVNSYGGLSEDRHTLGDGPAPGLRDIDRANRLALLVGRGALAVAVILAIARVRADERVSQ